MWVQVYREAGYEEAARACRLSRGNQHRSDTVGDELGSEDAKLFMNLLKADKKASGDPHAVGLRQIVFWIGVSAPLYWWKHMDRYNVGKDQASSSTMYTLLKRDLTKDDFQGTIHLTHLWFLNQEVQRSVTPQEGPRGLGRPRGRRNDVIRVQRGFPRFQLGLSLIHI